MITNQYIIIIFIFYVYSRSKLDNYSIISLHAITIIDNKNNTHANL